MGHHQKHRGAHPDDGLLFADSQLPTLRQALHDYCWLLSRGYAAPSSLKLVGDRFQLAERQRRVLMRSGCTEMQRKQRQSSRCSESSVAGCDLYLDGFNVLITVESALSGGFVFAGQDGCYRDLASVHGTYRRVEETQEAIRLIGETLSSLQIGKTTWLLDRPVSNSGRLRQMLIEFAQQQNLNWQVELCQNPDTELINNSGTVVSTDSLILDGAEHWLHLNKQVIDAHIPNARLIELRQDEAAADPGS
jgi:hypothetical protein